MSKKDPHDIDYNEFQKRFRAVDGAKGWNSRCTKKWNELKKNPLRLRGFYDKLLHGKEKAKSKAYTAGFNALFKKSGAKRVFAAVDESELQTVVEKSHSEEKSDEVQQTLTNKTMEKESTEKKNILHTNKSSLKKNLFK